MNRDQEPIDRRGLRRQDRARGLELARELGIDGRKALLSFCADKQKEASARGIACLALGFFRYKPAVPLLLELANDHDLSLVVNATRALEMIADQRAISRMLALAKEATRVEVRNRAIDVLGALGDQRAEETLVGILNNSAEAESTRCCAAEAIVGLRQPSEATIASLLGILKEPSPLLRWTALNTLGITCDQSTIPAIKAYLADKEIVPQLPATTTVASAARNALRNLRVCALPSSWRTRRLRRRG